MHVFGHRWWVCLCRTGRLRYSLSSVVVDFTVLVVKQLLQKTTNVKSDRIMTVVCCCHNKAYI